MSRDINPEALTKDDLLYIEARPNLRQEFILQGLGDPLEQDEEGNYVFDGYLGDDAEAPSPASEDVDISQVLTAEMIWVDNNTKAELESVIAARNAERDDPADKIVPEGDKKADLVSALQKDDQAIADWLREHPDE